MAFPLGALAPLLALGGAGAAGLQSKAQGGSFFKGTPEKFGKQELFTQSQQKLMSQLLEGLSGPSASGLEFIQSILSEEPGAFEAFEAPAKQQFEQETIPMIAERFAGLGAQSSSGLQQTLGQAGSDLSTQLASLRGGLKQNALSQLQGLMGTGFQPSFQPTYQPGTPGALGALGTGLSGAAGSAFGRLFGG